MTLGLLGGVLLVAAAAVAAPTQPAPTVQRAATAAAPAPALDGALTRLLAVEWDQQMAEDPVWASYLGDRRFNDRWPDLSAPARARGAARRRATLAALARMPASRLSPANQLNRQLYERELRGWLDSHALHAEWLAISHQEGLQSAHDVAGSLRFETVRDFEDWLGRLRRLPRYAAQTTALLEEGRAHHLLPPRGILQRVGPQLAAQTPANPEDSPFYQPFKAMPAGIPPATQARLRAAARAAVLHDVIPAYRRFTRYFETRYLPSAPVQPGLWAVPGGAPLYAHLARSATTTMLTPAALHQRGLAEVARIEREMTRVKEQTGFTGTLKAFFAAVKADARFKRTDPQAYLDEYRALAKRVDPLLLKLFGTLPRMPYGVMPIPADAAPNATAAYYMAAAADGSRAGMIYVNCYKPEARPAYEMVPLTLHESVPGHHLQLALQAELGELPAFRRHGGYTAYVEGWGLYAESLGRELGFYDDPYVWFGKLNMEMRRALRVVLDTGLHHQRWSRERAIAFFRDHAAKSELEIANEVDRYQADPGQALAYKVGEMAIQGIRARAERELGPAFDLRAFHDALLGAGALPLDVLEARMDAWIAAQPRGRKP